MIIKCLKEGSRCIFSPAILINCVFEMRKNYYPQIFQKDANKLS